MRSLIIISYNPDGFIKTNMGNICVFLGNKQRFSLPITKAEGMFSIVIQLLFFKFFLIGS